MSHLGPFRFDPIYRRYVWGGRRLATMLGKELGEGDHYAESWEVVDHGQDQSRVAAGPLQGVTLHEIVRMHGRELFGRHAAQPQFPLLFKFLDAHQNLSVQVHPNNEQAARLQPPDLGKTEAWVVLHADPGSLIYAGLSPGCNRAALERAVQQGAMESCLHRFHPQPGDCVFIPAGTVHALGGGLVVAEIQQASDTTYRLYDWDRLGPDGKSRPLHVKEALETVDYRRGPVSPQTPRATDVPHVERLVQCEQFVLDRWKIQSTVPVGGDNRFHLLAVLAGEVSVEGDCGGAPLRKGQTLLLPAASGPTLATPTDSVVLLDMYLP
jgi:mannose-6-phosphate isomerase